MIWFCLQLNKICGWYDAQLTEKGQKQAAAAGRTLREAGFSFDVAYTSNLSRAQDTLTIMLEQMGLQDIPIVNSWKLNER